MTTLKDVLGYYEKRDCPGNRFECVGSATFIRFENGVAIYLFKPNDARLKPVEAICT